MLNFEHISYPIMEHFDTLQGEGRYSGNAAYFIRLAGCNVGCVWCDVKESWDETLHPSFDLNTVAGWFAPKSSRIVVVTGGEPTQHNLLPITDLIHAHGKRAHIETSATNPITGNWDWITLSPKKFKAPLKENLKLANELKIIVFNKSDFAWAEEFAAQMEEGCMLYLQAEWDKRSEMTPLIIDYIKQHPKWQLSLQTHKYIDIP